MIPPSAYEVFLTAFLATVFLGALAAVVDLRAVCFVLAMVKWIKRKNLFVVEWSESYLDDGFIIIFIKYRNITYIIIAYYNLIYLSLLFVLEIFLLKN